MRPSRTPGQQAIRPGRLHAASPRWGVSATGCRLLVSLIRATSLAFRVLSASPLLGARLVLIDDPSHGMCIDVDGAAPVVGQHLLELAPSACALFGLHELDHHLATRADNREAVVPRARGWAPRRDSLSSGSRSGPNISREVVTAWLRGLRVAAVASAGCSRASHLGPGWRAGRRRVDCG
jgi:hypothetical protein